MTESQRGHVAISAARVYEEFFVPALFQEWAHRVAPAAKIAPGERVLDVACGTGVLARAARDRVGPGGSVVGLDINDAMLEVARQTSPTVEWRLGEAESLPFASRTFDAVVSQFGLMFFRDRGAALREFRRVLRANGRVAVAVWAELDKSPGYAAMADLLDDLFGHEAAESLRAPFTMGDPAALVALLRDAQFQDPKVSSESGTVAFPSMDAWMFTEIRGWTLAGSIDEADFDRLLAEAHSRLGQFEQPDGTVRFEIQALIATATV